MLFFPFMNTSCKNCQSEFEITPSDKSQLDNVAKLLKVAEIPTSALCPDCRQQGRLLFRNELNLYSRNCDKCKDPMISIYSSDNPHTVYCSKCWWSDDWTATDYGRDYDFNRPFFEQYSDLVREVPLLGSLVFNSVNSEYSSYIINSKDCYLSARIEAEFCLYSYLIIKSFSIVDSMDIYESENCYESIDCWNGYNLNFCQLCKNCSDCSFCYDCIGSKNCFGSVGLRNAEYVFFNKQCSQEEYEQYLEQYSLSNYDTIKTIQEKFYQEVILKHPIRAYYIVQSENSVGNYISESKNIYHCIDVEKSEDCSNSWGVEYSRDIHHCSFIYHGENCYETISNSRSTNVFFSFGIMDSSDFLYSIQCYTNCHNVFGSISLRQKKYCILNKQYSKEEYEGLLAKILNHMSETGELGEFFPPSLSTFAYNETIAQDYFPLSKEEAVKNGFSWREKDHQEFKPQEISIPKNIQDATKEICQKILACTDCGKNYKILPRELSFHQQRNIALPTHCPRCRHMARLRQRNPRKLLLRQCQKCSKNLLSPYAPDRPEKIYCNECYEKEVY